MTRCHAHTDGRAFRGLSEIFVLKRIVAGVNNEFKQSEELQAGLVFDMIRGTSIGG